MMLYDKIPPTPIFLLAERLSSQLSFDDTSYEHWKENRWKTEVTCHSLYREALIQRQVKLLHLWRFLIDKWHVGLNKYAFIVATSASFEDGKSFMKCAYVVWCPGPCRWCIYQSDWQHGISQRWQWTDVNVPLQIRQETAGKTEEINLKSRGVGWIIYTCKQFIVSTVHCARAHTH